MRGLLSAVVSIAALALGIGCQTASEYNPFVVLGDYETIVVEDFEGPGTVGFEFAERVARSIATGGQFSSIERSNPEGPAVRLVGEVVQYKKGNPALRLRYGRAMGNARFAAAIRLEDFETGEFIASFRVSESYEKELSRTILNQDLDTLAERAAEGVARRLETIGD